MNIHLFPFIFLHTFSCKNQKSSFIIQKFIHGGEGRMYNSFLSLNNVTFNQKKRESELNIKMLGE